MAALNTSFHRVNGCFNWAAVDRPRKPLFEPHSPSSKPRLQLGRGRSTAETAVHSLSPQINRFNWAAVDRPRKPAGLVRRSASIPGLKLQLGRGRSTAETPAAPYLHWARRTATAEQLQLGRGRSTAETMNSMQGRGRSTAETGCNFGIDVFEQNRFNWAAVDRPRKPRWLVDESPFRSEMLQLGRGRSTAETAWMAAEDVRSHGLLQLGRGRSTAETPIQASMTPRPAWRRPASIGPRSIDRGNELSTPPPAPVGQLHQAAVDRPRKHVSRHSDIGNLRLHSCFNWAAVDRSRKRPPRNRRGVTIPASSFIWAAVERPRKLGPGSMLRRAVPGWLHHWAAVDRPRKRQAMSLDHRRPGPASIGPRSIDRGNTRSPSRLTRFRWPLLHCCCGRSTRGNM